MFGAMAGIAGGVLGAIGGAMGSNSSGSGSQSSTSSVDLQDFNTINQGASQLENTAYQGQRDMYSQLTGLVNAGPGASAVSDATGAGNQFADLLQSFLNNKGLPGQEQISYANNYASKLFDPQRVALQQSFTDQNVQGQRLAARLGRSGADPVLQAKLGIEQTRQQQMLSSQQGAFAAQTANGMPQQQLGMSEALFNVRQNLATQAFNNRSTLLQLGNQLTASERNYRVATATRNNSTTGSNNGSSGGGLGGAIAGGLAGAGAGFGAAGGLSSMFSGSTKSVGGVGANTQGGINAVAG